MITKVKITHGFATKLKGVGRRTVKFKDGLNILYGPNGCGKTTLLETIAAYCMIPTSTGQRRGGWSRVLGSFDLANGLTEDPVFPDHLHKSAPGDTKAVVGWDGTPSFYYKSGAVDALPSYIGASKEMGVFSGAEELMLLTSAHSDGEIRMLGTMKLPEILDNPPDLLGEWRSRIRPAKEGLVRSQNRTPNLAVEYLEGLSPTDRITLLLDEPGRGLSVHAKFMFWFVFAPRLAKKHQVIASTHDPFVLFHPDAHIHDMNKGYQASAKAVMEHVVGGKPLKAFEKIVGLGLMPSE